MANYAKVDVRIWNDRKVKSLSPIPPCGQGLWIHLLVSEHRTSLPGVLRVGESALAEELGWSLEAFREAFREASSKGMVKADWKARFVWIPNACEYNRPESPNVVKSWRIPWDEAPECDLKAEAYWRLKAFMEGFAEGFRKAFAKACPEPSPNQEQEQEQDPDQEQEISPPAGARDPGTVEPEGVPPAPPAGPTTRMTGQDLVRRFGEIRHQVFPETLPWHTARDSRGDAGTFAALLRSQGVTTEDVEGTMRKALDNIRDGVAGWNKEQHAKDPSFAFGAWKSGFHGLLEELRGRAPPVAAQRSKAGTDVFEKWVTKNGDQKAG